MYRERVRTLVSYLASLLTLLGLMLVLTGIMGGLELTTWVGPWPMIPGLLMLVAGFFLNRVTKRNPS